MPVPSKIPEEQLKRVRALESRFQQELEAGNLKKAKLVFDQVKDILAIYNHDARMMQGYLQMYEAALELWELDLAKRGFRFVRERTSSNTRMHLEATTLLAIAYLRDRDVFSAEPLMAEVLTNEMVIKSGEQREQFRLEVVNRFDQEGALAALADAYPEHKAEAEVHGEALKLLREGKTDDELQEIIGSSVPQSVKDFLLKVDQMSKNLLPHDQRLLLPSPKEIIKNKGVGGVIFNGLKRKLYKYICDENCDAYQAWVRGGLEPIASKGFVASAVVGVMGEVRIAASAVAVGVTAMLMSQGIGNFCDKNRPKTLMALRNKSNK